MMKFRKIRNREAWQCLTTPTVIRKVHFCPEGKPYEVYNGHTNFKWFATLQEAKHFAETDAYFNGTIFKR